MADTIKLGLRLLAFSLIAAALLAGVNELTKGPIQRQAEQSAAASREGVLPGADQYEAVPLASADRYPGVSEVYRVLRGGEPRGYTITVSASGYKGPIVMTLAVNESGSINAVSINEQNETAGLGSRVAEDAFLSQFPGKAADPGAIADEIDAISGATVSSNAVIAGVETALRYAQDELGLEPHSGEVVTKEILSEYAGLENQTGATVLGPVSPYAAAGYPQIKAVYSASYESQEAYLFELEAGSVILSKDGAVLLDGGDQAALEPARGYFEKFLKGDVAQ